MTVASIFAIAIMFIFIGCVACLKLYVDLSQPRSSSVRPI